MLLHLGRIREYLCADASLAGLSNRWQTVSCLLFAKVDKQQLGAVGSILWIAVECVQHVEDTIYTKADTYTRDTRHTEDTSQVVVTTTTRNRTNLYVECLHLEDGTCVVVQTTSQCQVELNLVLQSECLQCVEDKACFLNALQSSLAGSQHLGNGVQLLVVGTLERDDRLQLLNLLVTQAVLAQLLVHVIESDLIQLVDSNGDIYNLLGSTDYLGDTSQNLAVVDLDLNTYAETAEYGIYNLHQLHLVQQRVGTYDVAIKLPELTVATLLWAVGAPNGLHLVALKRQLQFFAMHHHVAGKRYGKVVTQTLFAEFDCQSQRVTLSQFLGCNLREVVARVQHLKQQFVALFAVFTHQCAEGFHSGGLYLLKAVELIHLFDGIKNIIALRHLHWRKVTRSFRNTWFLCHLLLSYNCLIAVGADRDNLDRSL